MSGDFVLQEDESRLRFTFGTEWTLAFKWDTHDTNKGGLAKVIDQNKSSTPKGVDFLGLRLNNEPWFIEVKNFRKFPIENKRRLKNDGKALMKEVAEKVRDSIASLVWSCHRANLHVKEVEQFLKGLFFERKTRIVVAVWLEEEIPFDRLKAIAYRDSLRRELHWLNPEVKVVCRSLADEQPLPGISVRSLSDSVTG